MVDRCWGGRVPPQTRGKRTWAIPEYWTSIGYLTPSSLRRTESDPVFSGPSKPDRPNPSGTSSVDGLLSLMGLWCTTSPGVDLDQEECQRRFHSLFLTSSVTRVTFGTVRVSKLWRVDSGVRSILSPFGGGGSGLRCGCLRYGCHRTNNKFKDSKYSEQ